MIKQIPFFFIFCIGSALMAQQPKHLTNQSNLFETDRYSNIKFGVLTNAFSLQIVPVNNISEWRKRVHPYSHPTEVDDALFTFNLHMAVANPEVPHILSQSVLSSRWHPQIQEAKVHIRLRKKDTQGIYGAPLIKETMPHQHPANDFSKTPVPYYQTEGPTWENNKVGFRLYLDVRNGKDIFGKTIASMVLDTVGIKGVSNYHQLDHSWGMDILKVGKSLGAGALALQIKGRGLDTLVRLGGMDVGETVFETLKSGPDEAIIQMQYKDWKVLDRTYNVTEEISIKPDTYYYQSKVTINGLRGDEKLVTGTVNLNTKQSYKIAHSSKTILYTHDLQSENKDYLGMAVMVDNRYQPQTGKTPNTQSEVLNTYTMAMNVRNNQPVTFRFYAAWEKTDPQFKDQKYFKTLLQADAAKWIDP